MLLSMAHSFLDFCIGTAREAHHKFDANNGQNGFGVSNTAVLVRIHELHLAIDQSPMLSHCSYSLEQNISVGTCEYVLCVNKLRKVIAGLIRNRRRRL